MARPPRTPHPIEALLASQLRPRTVETYGRVAAMVEKSGLPAAQWLEREIARRAEQGKAHPDRAMPKRTLGVYRTAVAYYVALIEAPGSSRDAAAQELPRARALRDGHLRDALTDDQLACFRENAERAEEPFRTILLLLPLTGCRISEICGLARDRVDPHRRRIEVHGKGARSRWVPLGDRAWRVLSAYLGSTPEGAWAFEVTRTPGGAPVAPRCATPRDVWRVVAAWDDYHRPGGLLNHLALHQTRHTAATRMLRAGANVKVIQEVLGHRGIKSLERYLHTEEGERRAAVELLE